MDEERWEQFAELRDSALQTARAWGYKEHAMTLWAYRSRAWARKAWMAWYRGWTNRLIFCSACNRKRCVSGVTR